MNKKQNMSREEFKELFSPFLIRRLEPENYAKWERNAIHEMQILSRPKILTKDLTVADKVLGDANIASTIDPNTLNPTEIPANDGLPSDGLPNINQANVSIDSKITSGTEGTNKEIPLIVPFDDTLNINAKTEYKKKHNGLISIIFNYINRKD